MTDDHAIASRFAAGGRAAAAKPSFFARFRSEPLFPVKGSGGASLTAVIAVMAFLACLALAALLVISASAEQWSSDLQSGLTVQIKGPNAETIATEVAAASRALQSVDGVVSVTPLSPEESAALLEPWLGKGNVGDYLNIPGLIEVEVGPSLRRDLTPLKTALAAAAPAAVIDDHSAWHDRLKAAARSGEFLALGVFGLIMGAACAISVFAARAGLAANRDIVALLHLVGATDAFVATQVQRRFFAIGLRGALAGYAAAIAVFLVIGAIVPPGAGLLPDYRPDLAALLVLALVPIALCLATAVTARLAVLRSLEKEL